MASNKKLIQDYDPNYYDDDANICTKLLQLKENAESRNIEFTLSFAHLKRLLQRKTCYYTGRRFKNHPQHFRSIERIRNDEGYTDENTVAVCTVVNKLRGDLTLKELDNMVKQIKKHEQKRLKIDGEE